ncbi:protein phosphatase 1 regulatory subunit 14B-like [Argiope bruennichi]|uniref:protein phosphatase 1 regulatory subunit 14B-like n=1 Tax=Argiope bruennichi TaxID=94029 RepID=UPI002495912C|nr:protein phosphatase 1 regulatory subunit 14B-like [Argiope bruennichi]XP_055940210.1 protein phosphatase 1 regulatory subunit 14B-like [Argiope bruennichi]XP_055940211.1 protein phosphatase 1 regulatory subunit 14B-like [Argiope bruennichi]
MECTITSYSPDPPPVSRMKYMKADTTKTVLHVNFEPEKGEVQERKKKYLTAKYGQHQMNLIRKRLRVEMWMFDQLQALYGHRDEDPTSYDIEIDLDELLDIEGDFNRKAWLGGKVIGAKKSQENVEKFISELLQRAKTL